MTEEIKLEAKTQEQPIPHETKQTQETPQENIEEINWRKFRENREAERKAKEEAQNYAREKEKEATALKLAMEALVNKPASRMNDINQDDDLTQDQIIERKVSEAIRIRDIESEKIRIAKEKYEFPAKLVQTFKDFNQVCTTENLDYLEYHYPEVTRPYKHMPEGFDKWEGIYQALKRFIPNKDHAKDIKTAEKNLSKPQAISRAGATQSGDHAPHITDDAKRTANWNRMQKIIKGL